MSPRFAAERQQRIAEAVQVQGRVEVAELAQRFGVSPDTVRRDLRRLDTLGVLHKAHGGAVAPQGAFAAHLPARQRAGAQGPQKARIAAAALALVQPGQTLFINAGSTALVLAEHLRQAPSLRPLTVVTHSLDVAHALCEDEAIHLVLAGGDWVPHERHFVGEAGLAAVRARRADIAFLAACGLHPRAGLTVDSAGDAALCRAMAEGAAERIVLADATKLDRIAPCAVLELGQVDRLVSEAPPAWLAARTQVVVA
jgi:DeoR family glycerol-3-phosphate regulon repressor